MKPIAENSTWSTENRNALLCCCFIGDQKLTPRYCASDHDGSNANKTSCHKQDLHEQPKNYAGTVTCLKILAYRSRLGICFVSRNRVHLWRLRQLRTWLERPLRYLSVYHNKSSSNSQAHKAPKLPFDTPSICSHFAQAIYRESMLYSTFNFAA